MKLQTLPWDLTVCKLADAGQIGPASEPCFAGITDEEVSLVCRTDRVPENTLAREDGWRGFRIGGVLDFSLTGVLAKLSAVLAEEGIGIFAVSTFNTDYILVKAENLDRALAALAAAGYETED